MPNVGLIVKGGTGWIAGVHYLQGLLYGNSLLPTQERISLRLYLAAGNQKSADYEGIKWLAKGIHLTGLPPFKPSGLHDWLSRASYTVLNQRRWPWQPLLELPDLLHRHRTDVLFDVSAIQPELGIPHIVWIPDFQHVHRPDFFSVQERKQRDEQFARIMAHANRVIVSNQFSLADGVRLYPESRHKLSALPFTMYLGSDWGRVDTQSLLLKYQLPKKYLLFPSQFWKHKNHFTAFRAIHLLRERGLSDVVLVCTGHPEDYRFPQHAAELREFLATHNLLAAVRILGLLPRGDQVQLMRAAAAIIQPSLFEGWSALLEECRSLGKLVFASDIPMHQEQLTEQTQLFKPTSAEELAELLARRWPELTPGPNLKLEKAAEAGYRERIRGFAGQFAALCRSVVESPGTA